LGTAKFYSWAVFVAANHSVAFVRVLPSHCDVINWL